MRGNKPPPGDWPTLPKHYRYHRSRWWTTALQALVITAALGGGAALSGVAGYQAGIEKGKADQEQADYIASIAAITKIPTTTPSPAPVPGPPVAPVRTPAPATVAPAPVVYYWLHFSCGGSTQCAQVIGFSYGIDPNAREAMTKAQCQNNVATNAMGMQPWNGAAGDWCSTNQNASQQPP
jgi:hypothetical protein